MTASHKDQGLSAGVRRFEVIQAVGDGAVHTILVRPRISRWGATNEELKDTPRR